MLTREWASAADLAAMKLPTLPSSESGLIRFIKKQSPAWQCRRRDAAGGGVEYHYASLPKAAKAAFILRHTERAAEPEKPAKAAQSRETMAGWYEALPASRKEKAEAAALILQSVRRAEERGVPKLMAMAQASEMHGVAQATLYHWERLVRGAREADWRYWLAPRHTGGRDEAEIPARAWDALVTDYLRLERPSFTACARRLRAAAKERGWQLPSDRTLSRRLDALPPELLVLAREGEQALRRLFPAQARDRSIFHALEAVNADGHTFDVFVDWGEGEISRPVFVAFQDLYSGKMLSWRVDRTENKHAVRLALGDLVERFGIPSLCWFDNGRHFASKWLTGQAPNRYRFKIKDDEPAGILTTLGIEVRWTQPYSGQSKPIERAFRDFAGNFAKHPAFAGAYTGNKPDAKPENYRSKAVPIAEFLARLAEAVAEHNARAGRTSAVCAGRSFDQAFKESYEKSLITRATEEQRKLWLLAAEGVTVREATACLHLEGNRYWSEKLIALRGQKVIARFDPDDLHAGVHVYRLDSSLVCFAECVEATGFDSVEKAREHARNRNAWLRAKRVQLDAERRMSLDDLVALQPKAEIEAPPPETKLVRPLFGTRGNAALQPAPAERHEEESEADRLMRTAFRQQREARGAHLSIVPDADDET